MKTFVYFLKDRSTEQEIDVIQRLFQWGYYNLYCHAREKRIDIEERLTSEEAEEITAMPGVKWVECREG